MTTNNNAWMEVFSGEAFEAEVVKGLLEANGIGGDVRLLVAPADEAEARMLIEHKE